MSITFKQVEAWDGSRDVVAFPADRDGTAIQCAISMEALQDHFGLDGSDAVPCFQSPLDRNDRPSLDPAEPD